MTTTRLIIFLLVFPVAETFAQTTKSTKTKITLPPHQYIYNPPSTIKTGTTTTTPSTKTTTTPTTTSGSKTGTTSPTQTQNISSGKTVTGGSSSTSTKTTTGTSNNTVTNVANSIWGGSGNFTQTEAANAIKEALLQGVTNGVKKVAVTNGYFGNSLIKIPFPQDAQIIEKTLRSAGMGSTIDKLVLSLNRAAESAATQAGPIFVNSIKQMTINDAISIVSNKQPDAATQFLQRTTTESLVAAFKPSIKTALDKTLATKYWADIMSTYNKIPFVQKINPDLNDFVTRKAISGLFYMVGQEEAKIRKDPVARTTDILQKVFGGIKL